MLQRAGGSLAGAEGVEENRGERTRARGICGWLRGLGRTHGRVDATVMGVGWGGGGAVTANLVSRGLKHEDLKCLEGRRSKVPVKRDVMDPW